MDNGDLVKDVISGFKGIVIGRSTWINGCVRLTVRPQGVSKETGKPFEADCFDEGDLVLVKARAVAAKARDTDFLPTDEHKLNAAIQVAEIAIAPRRKKGPGGPMPKVSMF
jgi:hypothetical protein